MIKLRYGYLGVGIFFGLWLLTAFLWTLPDGKLHMYFCDVGQGDGSYIRFPDGRDMVIDGGPDSKIIECLSRYMPFWDRSLDIVLLTHPQKDHMQGLIEVMKRYSVGYFIKSDVHNSTEGYEALQTVIRDHNIPVKHIVAGDSVVIGDTALSFVWPSREQIAKAKSSEFTVLSSQPNTNVLGYQGPPGDVNDYSLVFFLRYGTFDVLFTGDADTRVEPLYAGRPLPDATLEVLKVPHHGSKTGMTDKFVQWLNPQAAVISVSSRNSYGHPTREALDMLHRVNAQVFRTDQSGDVALISDGVNWSIAPAQ